MPAQKKRAKPRHGIVVLGMHRSGTSALSGVLGKLGCDLPRNLMPANEFNPRGYFESLKIYKMNDSILASGGSSWDDWQEFNSDWMASPYSDHFLENGRKVLSDEYGKSRLFVLKDPRICRLLPFWQKLFEKEGIKPVYVAIHRNPLEVAKSLQNREGWDFAYGLLLWLRHVLDAEIRTRGGARVFTSYDRLLSDWEGVVSAVQTQTGISFPRSPDTSREDLNAFLNLQLYRNIKPKDNLSKNPLVARWIQETFRVLEKWAGSTEDPEDYDCLDTIRNEFNAAAPVFSTLIEGARATAKEMAALKSERDFLADQVHSKQQLVIKAHYDALANHSKHRQLEAAHKWNADLQKSVEASLENERQLRCELADREADLAELDTLHQEVKTLKDEKWQIHSELAQRRSEIDETRRQNQESKEREAQLMAELDSLSKECKALKAARDDIGKNARLTQLQLQDAFQKQLTNIVVNYRKRSDNDIHQLQEKLKVLQDDVSAANEAAQAAATERDRLAKQQALKSAQLNAANEAVQKAASERDALLKIQAEQDAHIASVKEENAEILRSTSWRLTAPLRRLKHLLTR